MFWKIQTVVTALQFNPGDLPTDCERVTRHIKKAWYMKVHSMQKFTFRLHFQNVFLVPNTLTMHFFWQPPLPVWQQHIFTVFVHYHREKKNKDRSITGKRFLLTSIICTLREPIHRALSKSIKKTISTKSNTFTTTVQNITKNPIYVTGVFYMFTEYVNNIFK